MRRKQCPVSGSARKSQYDGLNNLLGVCQGGTWSGSTCQNGLGRSFTYSSLSRLTSVNNPESGVINYVYL